MKKPVVMTLIFGLVSATCTIPFSEVPADWRVLSWPLSGKLFFMLTLAAYCLLLCRWSNTRPGALLLPLALLSGAALWPTSMAGFGLAGLVVFSWVRSGICYRLSSVGALLAEVLTLAGGAGLLLVGWRGSVFTAMMAVWLFFLVQSLYFFLVPTRQHTPEPGLTDSFENASQEMERLLQLR